MNPTLPFDRRPRRLRSCARSLAGPPGRCDGRGRSRRLPAGRAGRRRLGSGRRPGGRRRADGIRWAGRGARGGRRLGGCGPAGRHAVSLAAMAVHASCLVEAECTAIAAADIDLARRSIHFLPKRKAVLVESLLRKGSIRSQGCCPWAWLRAVCKRRKHGS